MFVFIINKDPELLFERMILFIYEYFKFVNTHRPVWSEQPFSWNDLTRWAAVNPLAAPAHSLILLAGLKETKDQSSEPQWRTRSDVFTPETFINTSACFSLTSLRFSSVSPVEGGGAGQTCGPAPLFSLFVCAFILKGNLSSRLHTNTGSPSDTLTPCGNSSTLWRTHATTRHRAQRCLYGCAQNPASFWTLLYLYSTVVSTMDLYFIHFMFLFCFICHFFYFNCFFYWYNFMFSIFLIQLFYFYIFLT